MPCLLVDAGAGLDTEAIIGNIEKAGFSITDCKGGLLTHAHADHVGGAKELTRQSGATVFAWKKSAEYLSTGAWDKIALSSAIEAGVYPVNITAL